MNIKLLSQLIDVVQIEDKTILSKPNIVKKIRCVSKLGKL